MYTVHTYFVDLYVKGINLSMHEIYLAHMYTRMSKVVADHGSEFSGELARPKNYENGHKNIFGLSVDLGSKVGNNKILSF